MSDKQLNLFVANKGLVAATLFKTKESKYFDLYLYLSCIRICIFTSICKFNIVPEEQIDLFVDTFNNALVAVTLFKTKEKLISDSSQNFQLYYIYYTLYHNINIILIVLIFNALVAATLFKAKKYKFLRFFKSCEVLTKLVDRLREAGGRAQQIRRLQLVGKIRMKRQKDKYKEKTMMVGRWWMLELSRWKVASRWKKVNFMSSDCNQWLQQ